ncbi:MAG: AMP-binding enzyme [Acidimicrobiales bacterium]
MENRLIEHPRVAEAAVIGVSHPVLGEEVKAIVRLEPGLGVGVGTSATAAASPAPSLALLRLRFRPRSVSRRRAQFRSRPRICGSLSRRCLRTSRCRPSQDRRRAAPAQCFWKDPEELAAWNGREGERERPARVALSSGVAQPGWSASAPSPPANDLSSSMVGSSAPGRWRSW